MKTITFRTLSLVLFFAFLFFSCKEDTPSTRLLKQAQEQADTHPKKALQLLDSIQNPQKMDKESYMKYIIARTQAKYKAKQDISEDTLVFEAQRYFENKNNPKESALANFYSGHIYYENGITEKALEHFLKASSLAQQNNDNILTGRSLYNIGNQYYQDDLMDSTIIYYLKALSYFEKENNTDLFKIQTIYELGVVYYAIHNLDGAYASFEKGLNLAEQIDNQQYQRRFMQGLGAVYREQGRYQQASNNLHTVLNQIKSSADSLRIYLNLSQLHNYMNRPDSAQYYTAEMKNRLSEISDIYTLRNIYATFSEYNKQEGNYSEALRYADLEKEIRQKIKEENKALELLEADKKVILEQKDKEMQRQIFKTYLRAGGVILFLLVIFGCAVIMNRKEMRTINAEIKRIGGLRNRTYDKSSLEQEVWAIKYLQEQTLGERLKAVLRNRDMLFVALWMNGYSKAVIAAMTDMPLANVDTYKSKLAETLRNADFTENEINSIFESKQELT